MNNNGNAPSKLMLQPNVPELIALKYPTGKIVDSRFGPDEKQVYFSLVDGRAAYLSLGIANKIYALQLGNREEFYICKKATSKAQQGYVDVWLAPEGEKARARAEMEAEPPSLLERQLAASLHERKPAASAPPVQSQGTGTYGPVAMPSRAPQAQQLQPWGVTLLNQTNALSEVYAQACLRADELSVSHAAVRTFMLSAFISLSKKGGG